MARAGEKEGVLRGCPVCGTRVADVDIGLRDFRWVNEALPGRVGLMDIDGCLTQVKTGRALMLELKPKGARISMGAKLTYALFVKKGIDVWVLWDQGNGRVKLTELDDTGAPGKIRELTHQRAATLVKHWWEEGL